MLDIWRGFKDNLPMRNIETQKKTFASKAEAEDYAREMRARGWSSGVKAQKTRAGFVVTSRRPLW